MYLPSCLDGVLVDLVWRLFSNHGICAVGDASPKHKEIRTNEVFGNDKRDRVVIGFPAVSVHSLIPVMPAAVSVQSLVRPVLQIIL